MIGTVCVRFDLKRYTQQTASPNLLAVAIVSSEELIKSLAEAEILSDKDLRSLRERLVPTVGPPKGVQELVADIVRGGQLTKFQGRQILAGRIKALVLGDYVILDKIGSGGMGQVYKARHRRMNRVVALKILPPAMLQDAQAIKRFQHEVEAAAKLLHPNIVTAFDAGEANRQHYLVMEYVEGHDLAAIVRQQGPLPLDKALGYITQAARGLAFAHSKGVVHRDVKPANLLVDVEGTVKILDMGLAHLDDPMMAEGLTQSGQMMGTVDYMAPEQAFNSRHADARADIYSLGCTLYRLLTGEPMYAGESLVQVSLAHRDQAIPDLRAHCPAVSSQLATVFLRMVAKRAEDRYQSMKEVVSALEAVGTAHAETVSAMDATAPYLPAINSATPNATQAAKRLRPLAEAVSAEKAKHWVAKLVAGLFATILAPILVAFLLKYFDKGDSSAIPPLPAATVTSGATVPPSSAASPQTPDSAPRAAPESPPATRIPQTAAEHNNPRPTSKLPSAMADAGRMPSRAVAPFSAPQARAFQQAWARHLGVAVERKNSVGMQMVLIPPGAFMMGSPEEQAETAGKATDDRKDRSSDVEGSAVGKEIPQHRVILGRAFLLAATEVTVSQFARFVEATEYVTDAERFGAMGAKREKHPVRSKLDWRHPGRVETEDSPVTQVTWHDAVCFCNWLSESEKLKPCYTKDANNNWILLAAGDGYVLPTEAEWEFACRAGTTTQFSFGDAAASLEDYGWYGKNSGGRPKPVGLKRPNPFGLYDMHGNVWEWCHDWYAADYYANSPRANPFGPDSGSAHVARGGSWDDPQGNTCRSASRLGHAGRNNHRGFRVACLAVRPGAEKGAHEVD